MLIEQDIKEAIQNFRLRFPIVYLGWALEDAGCRMARPMFSKRALKPENLMRLHHLPKHYPQQVLPSGQVAHRKLVFRKPGLQMI